MTFLWRNWPTESKKSTKRTISRPSDYQLLIFYVQGEFFSNQGFFNLKFKFTVKAIIFYDNMARWKPYMEQSSTRSTIFVILLTMSPRNIISWILRQRKRQIESSTVHLDVLITIMTVYSFLTVKQLDLEKDFFSATILT